MRRVVAAEIVAFERGFVIKRRRRVAGAGIAVSVGGGAKTWSRIVWCYGKCQLEICISVHNHRLVHETDMVVMWRADGPNQRVIEAIETPHDELEMELEARLLP